MGGGSAKRQAREANARQEQANALMQQQNAAREEQWGIQQGKFAEMQASMMSQAEAGRNRIAEGQAKFASENKAREDASALIGNYEKQERRRLFNAKTGQGQTKNDNRIGADAYQRARELLGYNNDVQRSDATTIRDAKNKGGGATDIAVNKLGVQEEDDILSLNKTSLLGR